MEKKARHQAIREILNSQAIGTQDDLRRELHKRRFRVTQATLSRDMKDLSVNWMQSGGSGRYAIGAASGSDVLRPIVGAEVLAMEANECMIVVQTVAGAAGTVGEFVDMLHHAGILGTVAGDNTLLVIPRSTRHTKEILQFLRHTLGEKHT